MRTRRQDFLPGFHKIGLREFGGSLLLKGNPREARPISLKRPIHVVLKSSLAKGNRSFLNPARARKIERLVHALAKQKGVRVYRFANSGNHLHLLVQIRSRESFQAYIRALTGIIARLTLAVERGRALGKKFWDARPYTRIVEWGKEFKTVSRYIVQNTLEALGFIPYQPRLNRLRPKLLL